jgi:hypothetical protein
MQGNKVKLVMKFEGRELQFKDQGKEVLLVGVGAQGWGRSSRSVVVVMMGVRVLWGWGDGGVRQLSQTVMGRLQHAWRMSP